MFGLFSSRPPLTVRQRAELELLMRDCLDRLDVSVVRDATVIGQLSNLAIDPTDAQSLLTTATTAVQRHMQQTDAIVQLSIRENLEQSACYQFSTCEIFVSPDTVTDPLRLVTSLAREYGRHLLYAVDPNSAEQDDDRLCDLVALCFGFGVLQSDASLYFRTWSVGEWGGWDASKQGHLSAQEIGYALALLARFRGEPKPSWIRWLRADSRETVKQALRYFRRRQSAESPLLFDADRIPSAESTTRDLASWLVGDDPTFALAAAWQVCALDELDLTITAGLHAAIESDDVDVVPVAISLLAGASERDEATRQQIQSLLRDRRPGVALAAAKAAYGLGMDLAEHAGMLGWLLDKLPEQRLEILPLIASGGHRAGRLDESICHLLVRSLKSLDDLQSQGLAKCLIAISDQPQATIEKLVSAGPIRDEALALLEQTS